MTFYTFMTHNYENANSPAGDFARDMKRDAKHFPRNRPSSRFEEWHQRLRDYLINRSACDVCLETFEKCWEEYVKREKKRMEALS